MRVGKFLVKFGEMQGEGVVNLLQIGIIFNENSNIFNFFLLLKLGNVLVVKSQFCMQNFFIVGEVFKIWD